MSRLHAIFKLKLVFESLSNKCKLQELIYFVDMKIIIIVLSNTRKQDNHHDFFFDISNCVIQQSLFQERGELILASLCY